MKQVTPIMLSRTESGPENNLQQTWEKSFSLALETTGARRVPGSVLDDEMELCSLWLKEPLRRSAMPVGTMTLKR